MEDLNKSIDTEKHISTREKKHETTIFKFKDPRRAKLTIYPGCDGLEWALMNLTQKTNKAITENIIEGKVIEVGDIVQGCVVRYFLNGQVYEPETTPDSPKYATLPYEIIEAEEGYLTSRVAVPKEMLLQIVLPTTVGDLIPILNQEERNNVLVTLQLKQATKISKQEELEQFFGKQTGTAYVLGGDVNDEAVEFAKFLKDARYKESDRQEWSDYTSQVKKDGEEIEVEEVGDLNDFVKKITEEQKKADALKKKITKSDQQNFGFNL